VSANEYTTNETENAFNLRLDIITIEVRENPFTDLLEYIVVFGNDNLDYIGDDYRSAEAACRALIASGIGITYIALCQPFCVELQDSL